MTCINKYYFGCGCDTPTSEDCQGSLGDDCCEILINKMDKLLCRMDKMENKLCKCLGCECAGEDEDKCASNITLLGGTALDLFRGLISTEDGYVACGDTFSDGAGQNDAMISRFDKKLNLLSKTTIGGTSADHLSALALSGDGSYFFAGATSSPGSTYYTDGFTVGMDSNLVVTHKKFFGRNATRHGFNSVAVVPADSNNTVCYVAVGQVDTVSSGNYEALIMTYDKDYNILKKVNTVGNGNEFFKGVVATAKGFVAVGYSSSTSTAGNYDCFIVSFDHDLNVLKTVFIGSTGEDYLNAIAKTTDGYVVGGYTKSTGFGSYDGLVLTLDEDLNLVKKVVLGGTGSDIITSIAVTQKGDYVVTGNTNSTGAGGDDVMLVTLDKDLNILEQLIFGGSGAENATAVVVSDDGSYAVAGSTTSVGAGNGDAFIATFCNDFSNLGGNMAKYPALSINNKPGLIAKSDFSFTVNANSTMTYTNNPAQVINGNPSLSINTNPIKLIVDANAVPTA